MWRKGNPDTVMVGRENGAVTAEDSMEVPQKTKNRTTTRPSSSTSRYFPEENTNTNLKRYTQPYVHCSTVYNCQDMEAT